MEVQEQQKSNSSESVQDVVVKDIERYLGTFANRSFGIRSLCSTSKINPKTIKRILSRQNNPTYQTIFKIYAVIFSTNSESEVLKKVPPAIGKLLQKCNPIKLRESVVCDYNFLEMIKSEPLYSELIILAGAGSLHLTTVSFRYGEYGVELLSKLEELKILKRVSREVYELTNNLPQFDGEIIKELGLRFVSRFSKTSNMEVHNKNVLSFYSESLNEAGMKKWLEIDTEAFQRKVEVANSPQFKGNYTTFTFNATDTVMPEKKNV